MTKLSFQELALTAGRAALDKKAEDVQVLDMREITAETDFFVICSATSLPHLRSISEEIIAKLEECGATLARREGRHDNHWILLDYQGVVVHVFLDEERDYYGLEKLWADAEPIPLED